MPETPLATANMFADIQDLMTLDYAYLGAVSPENLALDGMRSLTEQQQVFKRIQRDYADRHEQLLHG